MMLVQEVPPLVLICHCTVGAGVPVPAAVNVTVAPLVTVWLVGLPVITGADNTVRVAAELLVEPAVVENTARYWLPLYVLVVSGVVYVVLVAPPISLQLEPPSVLSCHFTVGAGDAVAAAENVAVAPAFTVVLAGCVVTTGTVDTTWLTALLVLPA